MSLASIPEVDPRAAHALMQQGYVYVDVRNEAEFADGRPAGAVNVPWQPFQSSAREAGALERDFVARVAARWPTTTPLVIGCKSGSRSRKTAALLVRSGHSNVTVQRAGFFGARDHFGRVTEPGWVDAGLPVEADAPSTLAARA